MEPILIPAGNASEWTGPTGNNTWLLRGREPTLVDAGVGAQVHLDAIAQALDGALLARVLVTHNHPDHVGGIPALTARWPSLEIYRGPVRDADTPARVRAGDDQVTVIPTPGHAPDHLCFLHEPSGDLYCGDMARRGGTIVIPAAQGGNLREYLASLERIRALRPVRLLPGHGPVIADPGALIDEYIAHRRMRDAQIASAIAAGASTIEEIVRVVYPQLSARLREAAEETVRAHLAAGGSW
jgi:glyoxylase-like metal-dependent hydrolase (beta-lactamase superfamily II)